VECTSPPDFCTLSLHDALPIFSELFPEVARHVDELCFLSGMHTEGQSHGQAVLFLHTGNFSLARPSVGSWVTYGLGTENQDLPRSEEHTSELQSRRDLVCRLLL